MTVYRLKEGVIMLAKQDWSDPLRDAVILRYATMSGKPLCTCTQCGRLHVTSGSYRNKDLCMECAEMVKGYVPVQKNGKKCVICGTEFNGSAVRRMCSRKCVLARNSQRAGYDRRKKKAQKRIKINIEPVARVKSGRQIDKDGGKLNV